MTAELQEFLRPPRICYAAISGFIARNRKARKHDMVGDPEYWIYVSWLHSMLTK